MAEFLARLKQRKLVQWALAYVAFALIQVLDAVAGRARPHGRQRNPQEPAVRGGVATGDAR